MSKESSEEEPVPTTAVVLHQQDQTTLFRTNDPVAVLEKAGAVATALKNVLKKQGLTVAMGRDKDGNMREHVRVEGWTLLGSMLGVFPVLTWTRPVRAKDDGAVLGWEARVEAKTKDGSVVGAAEAMAMSDETIKTKNGPIPASWTGADFSIRSMAQTRATAKALRIPLGFVVTLAGYDATPAEEMPQDDWREQGDKAFSRSTEPKEAAKEAPQEREEAPERPPATDSKGRGYERKISKAQATRFWAQVGSAGVRTDEQAKEVLKLMGYQESGEDVQVQHYEYLVFWANGKLNVDPVKRTFSKPAGM